MTVKQEIKDGWKHFCDCINFGASNLDAEAINFMNTFGKMIDEVEQ